MGPSPVLRNQRSLLADVETRRTQTVYLARQKCATDGCFGVRELRKNRERPYCTSCRKRRSVPSGERRRSVALKWSMAGRGYCVIPGCHRLQEIDICRGKVRVRQKCQTCRKLKQRPAGWERRQPLPLGSSRVDGGYVVVKTERGWEREHRMVMERVLGRPLTERESVHHINGVRSDNRPENLELRTRFHGAGQAWCCEDCGSRNVVPVGLAA